MKIGMIGDTHIGARGGNPHVRKFIAHYFREYLFPKFKELGVSTYLQSGDITDKRSSISAFDMDYILSDFIPLHIQYGIEGEILTGNHDIALKDSNRISWADIISRLSEGFINAYQSPKDVHFGTEPGQDVTICMLPWINSENYVETLKYIEASKATIAFGHLELSGFPMYRNSVCDESPFELPNLNKFERVISGHFHTASQEGNVQYLGTPYHLTWQDYPDPRGFYVYDTVTKELTFYENPEHLTLFKVFEYSWAACEADAALQVKLKEPTYLENEFGLKGSIVKVIVKDRGNAKHYADFCNALRRCDLIDYNVIDHTESVAIREAEGGEGGEDAAPIIAEADLQVDIITVLQERMLRDETADVKLVREVVTEVHEKAIKSGDL